MLKLAQKVRWAVDEEAERVWPKRYPAQVDITLTDGSVLRARVEWPKGDPENPASEAELAGKFKNLATPVLGVSATSRAYDELRELADLPDVRAAGRLLAG